MFNVICSMIMIYIDPPLEHPSSQTSFVTETIPFQCCRGELLLRILSTRRISLCVIYFIAPKGFTMQCHAIFILLHSGLHII